MMVAAGKTMSYTGKLDWKQVLKMRSHASGVMGRIAFICVYANEDVGK